ncbi:aminopeptidase Y precursor vacuolar [Fusarium circinatum]|uniref:Peptide hydrolase n=1 Tax=Fusarium circinatum TaxID=48490 RepID=A0A8H5SZL6_FUSCI|nr:aminopeptidase Y precursor vacuolar [Fusarium circinatum]
MKLTTAAALLALSPLTEAAKPPVSSKKLQKLITEKGLMHNLKKLNDIAYANGGNRAFGLPGYAASVDFIYHEISKLKGFKTWKQDFPANFTQTLAAEVTVDDETFRTVALTYTPSTSEDGVTAELVHGPEGTAACGAANYEGLDVEGKVVLVERGLCPDGTTFAGRVKPAAAAGAQVVVIYNSDEAKLTAGTLSAPNPKEYVPTGLIDQDPGKALKTRLDAGEKLEVFVKIIQTIETRITQNVFAETKGGDGENVVMLGAHLDSVQAGPGINDDGLRFGWWGAEENGLVGSRYYVNNLKTTDVDNLLAYLNFDMVSRGFFGVFDGTGEKVGPGGPPGSDAIEDLFREFFEKEKIEVTPIGLTGGTDYVAFREVIKKPVGGLFTGTGLEQDACYHQACDNITNPVPETLHINAKAAAHVLSKLAIDGVKLIPKTPSNTTVGSIKRVRDAASLHMHDVTGFGGKPCDHDII